MTFHSELSRSFARMIALVAVLVSIASCGSGFMEGWRDNSPNPSGIPSAVVCEQKDGFSWVNGECVKDDDLNLNDIVTEEQCATIKNAYWVDNKCVRRTDLTKNQCSLFQELQWTADKCLLRAEAECLAQGKFFKDGQCHDQPVIEFTSGAREQNLTSGAAFEPIQFTVTEGAIIRIEDSSCPGYFVVNGNQIIANADVKPAAGQNTCKATLIADKNGIESAYHEIKVTFLEGFIAYCTSPNGVDIDVLNFTWKLYDSLEAENCESAFKKLNNLFKLEVVPDTRIIRIDALQGLRNLKWLEIRGHSVEDVSPVASLSGLIHLDLSNGNIKDVRAFAKLPNLKRLILDGNPIANGTITKSEANCPTAAGTNAAVKEFCEKK